MARGFTVESVEIEGFKGFTSPKHVDFKGRHVFLLGQNGRGKSSIVEAVRWGLFGSAYRPNEVVKNQHYSGSCCVTIELTRDGEPWKLRRTLNLGTGSSSEPVLTDQEGIRHNIREVMPQLGSADAGEGAHIIFASQSAPLRRQPEDLDPFERTVLNYLGLTHPRALLSHLNEFIYEQTELEHQLDEELTNVRRSFDDQLSEEEAIRANILNAPPWGEGPTPSVVVSEQKARRFIEEITRRSLGDEMDGLSLDALIELAENSIDQRNIQDHGALVQDASTISASRRNLEDLFNNESEIETLKITIANTKSELANLNGGTTSNELHDQLKAAKFDATTESIRLRIAQDANDLIHREESDEVPCPICDTYNDRQHLESVLTHLIEESDDRISSKVQELELKLKSAVEIENKLLELQKELKSLREDRQGILGQMSEDERSVLNERHDVTAMIDERKQSEADLQEQIDDQTKWLASKNGELDRLKEENRFHLIQRRLNQLKADKAELDLVLRAYENLVIFGNTVRKIKESVESALNAQLARDIPRVSETLPRSFNALTRHAWYDRLVISKDYLPKLELKVGSSADPSNREDPTGVLNGQAESALTLVPYFAFSEADGAPTEVYLVMLDDPTRALDTEHIKILVERLQELGRNVQLIVASQETERFEDMMPDVFERDSYVVIEPTEWSPLAGPTLDVKYG